VSRTDEQAAPKWRKNVGVSIGQPEECEIQTMKNSDGGKVMAGVFDLVICVAPFIVGRKGVSGVGSRRELGAEDPNCKGAISVRAVRPTHNPESEGQCTVDPLLRVVFFVTPAVCRLALKQRGYPS